MSKENGQRVTSIADVQWVLHHLPATDTHVDVETVESGNHRVTLTAGWRKHDFSWRGSMWNAPPRLQAWAPELTAERKSTLGLPEADSALEVRWINKEANGGKQAFADGLREGDVIVAIADKSFHLNTRQFNAHIKLNFKVGETLPLTVLRAGKRINLTIQLVE